MASKSSSSPPPQLPTANQILSPYLRTTRNRRSTPTANPSSASSKSSPIIAPIPACILPHCAISTLPALQWSAASTTASKPTSSPACSTPQPATCPTSTSSAPTTQLPTAPVLATLYQSSTSPIPISVPSRKSSVYPAKPSTLARPTAIPFLKSSKAPSVLPVGGFHAKW